MNLNEKIKRCQLCSLFSCCYSPLSGFGCIDNCELLVIIDRPTKEDDLVEGICFDRSGKYLKKILQQNEVFNPSKIYITCAVKCFGKINRKIIKTCSFWLKEEIKLLNPKFVLCMGKTAIFAFGHIYSKNNWDKPFDCIDLIDNKIVGYFNSPEILFRQGIKTSNSFLKLLNNMRKEYLNVHKNFAIL